MVPQYYIFGNAAGKRPTRESVRGKVEQDWVWCQGWSPHGGAFGRPMRRTGYGHESAAELAHPASGCKNVSTATLSAAQIEKITRGELPKLQAKYDCDLARETNRNSALRAAHVVAESHGFGTQWDQSTIYVDGGATGHIFCFGPLEITVDSRLECGVKDYRKSKVLLKKTALTRAGNHLSEREFCHPHFADPILAYILHGRDNATATDFFRAVSATGKFHDTEFKTEAAAIEFASAA